MKLALLMLMVVYMVGNVSGMSTCKTVDLEMVKKKRIEAIRSQILSKLRLPKEPEPDQAGDEEEIPTTLLSLYNSTKEILKEQQAEVHTEISTEQEEEEYFAKVLHKFNMTSEYQKMCIMHTWTADGLTTALRMSCNNMTVIYVPTFTGFWGTLYTHTGKQKSARCTVSIKKGHSTDLTLTFANSGGAQ